jgi:predicted deacetylase
MQMFTGPYLPEEQFIQLQGMVEQRRHIILRRFTSRFLAYMEQADLSISMAGYNTCMNILTTGVRALVLPFTGGNNTEQTIRADKLEALGAVTVIRPQELQPDRLAEKILQCLKTESASPLLDTHGVETTAAFLTGLLEKRETAGRSPGGLLPTFHQQHIGRDVLETDLRPHLERLQGEERDITLFLRDDDVDEDEETLRHLLDIALARGVPLNLEVIPGRLTEAGMKLLDSYKRFCPTLLELHQHGWRHINHEQEGRKCEFGISRGFDEQLQDISQGKALLEEIFEARFYPVFTPPWNRCTEDTFKVLDQLGFQGLSKDQDKHPVTGYNFREISITLDLYRWKGGVAMKSPEEIVQTVLSQMRQQAPIGILLHHKVMDAHAFAFLDRLLAALAQSPRVQFHTFEHMLQSIT